MSEQHEVNMAVLRPANVKKKAASLFHMKSLLNPVPGSGTSQRSLLFHGKTVCSHFVLFLSTDYLRKLHLHLHQTFAN